MQCGSFFLSSCVKPQKWSVTCRERLQKSSKATPDVHKSQVLPLPSVQSLANLWGAVAAFCSHTVIVNFCLIKLFSWETFLHSSWASQDINLGSKPCVTLTKLQTVFQSLSCFSSADMGPCYWHQQVAANFPVIPWDGSLHSDSHPAGVGPHPRLVIPNMFMPRGWRVRQSQRISE